MMAEIGDWWVDDDTPKRCTLEMPDESEDGLELAWVLLTFIVNYTLGHST